MSNNHYRPWQLAPLPTQPLTTRGCIASIHALKQYDALLLDCNRAIDDLRRSSAELSRQTVGLRHQEDAMFARLQEIGAEASFLLAEIRTSLPSLDTSVSQS